MPANGQVRWGIIGTANIARAVFLPGLRQAGGEASAVAGREAGRAEKFASDNGIGRSVVGYQTLIDDPDIDALYIPLPNALHAEWTIRALEAGKPVLCEKPLCGVLPDTERVLATARRTQTLLWEAFSFPFHAQLAELKRLVADGAIGELVEIKSNFHFMVRSQANIRLSRELQGGALLDVGCYPVRLARDLFGAEHQSAWAQADYDAGGVDVETWGCLDFPDGRHLYLSCGFGRGEDTFTRLLGTGGQINVTNPFHPAAADTFEVRATGREPVTHPGAGPNRHSFTPVIQHIQAVVNGEESPRLLAVDTSLGSALALQDLAGAAKAA